jgi:cobyrinic acid a,c-diamide synthase
MCAALRDRGLSVQPFKKGPDYIDPMWLSLASQRDCHNLDFYLMGRDEILQTFHTHVQGADIALIEANKGLYDGLSLDGSNSNAALAHLLNTPVILVIDARGMTRGIAPLILGYQAFDRNIRLAGVILNQLGGSRHEAKLRAVIEHYTDIPVLGAVHHDDRLTIVERHLGLIPSNEASEAHARIDTIAATVAASVNLDLLLEVAAKAPPLIRPAMAPSTLPKSVATDVRLGIARDAAFAFYYPGDLEALREAGAELIPIDTLRNTHLPKIDGLFIGGGFPEVQMDALAANTSLRRELRQAIDSGLPVYAECGGLMYLSRGIRWQGRHREMVGALPMDTVMCSRPQGRGYVLLRETGKSPWTLTDDTQPPPEIRGHEFHYSSLENLDPRLEYAYEVVRGSGIDGHRDGIVYKNVLACYTHLRDLANHHWAKRFVSFVRKHKKIADKVQITG